MRAAGSARTAAFRALKRIEFTRACNTPHDPFYRFAARGAIIPFLKMVSRQTVSGLENIPREAASSPWPTT